MSRIAVVSIAAFVLFVALALAFAWNEARKEVVFLCGNFTPGVSEESVVRQLDTGHFLRQTREAGLKGSRITVDSTWNFGVYRCVIELGEDGLVEWARVE